jgi:hypothetical protein
MVQKKSDTSVVPLKHQEFRKANEVIAPRVARGGTLSLLGRKIFNVLLYHMQRLESPGVGSPDDDISYKSLYWLPLSDLAKDSAFNSEDTGLLKETLLKLQDIKIITDDEKGFSSDVLVASVKIVPGKRGQKTMLGWGMHPATEAILRSPVFYTRLSIHYLTSLRTTAGMALYENCKRYATNPSKLTRRESWSWWFDVLTGQPVGHEKPQFKYFKRDVLKPAIAEVNTTDIRVELIEHKNGRKVEELQFRIEIKAQDVLEFPPQAIIDTLLISRITSLGILQREAEDIYTTNEESFLKATLDLVDAREKAKNLPVLVNSAAFFRTALRGKYVQGKKILTNVSVVKKPTLSEQPENNAANKARKEMRKQVDTLSFEDKKVLLLRYSESNPSLAYYATKVPTSRIVREALVEWMLGLEHPSGDN